MQKFYQNDDETLSIVLVSHIEHLHERYIIQISDIRTYIKS